MVQIFGARTAKKLCRRRATLSRKRRTGIGRVSALSALTITGSRITLVSDRCKNTTNTFLESCYTVSTLIDTNNVPQGSVTLVLLLGGYSENDGGNDGRYGRRRQSAELG